MKSKPFLENGLEEVAVSLAMGLRGEGGREGEEGVESVSPKWLLTLITRLWSTESALHANRISSDSSRFMRRYPMIFEAFSGSKFFILERTTLVASKEPMKDEILEGEMAEGVVVVVVKFVTLAVGVAVGFGD